MTLRGGTEETNVTDIDIEEVVEDGERSSPLPLWRQIEASLRSSILKGDFPAGSRLPPDRQVAANFAANRMTARRALAALEQQGLIRIEHGNGMFVAEDLVRYKLGSRVRFNQNLAASNVWPGRRLLRSEEVEADAKVAARLQIAVGDAVLRFDLLASTNDRPISVGLKYVPADRFRGLDHLFRQEQSFTKALRHFGIEDYRRKTTEIIARLPNALEARLLRQPRSQPVLAWEAVDIDDQGTPISYQRGCFAGERVAFTVDGDV